MCEFRKVIERAFFTEGKFVTEIDLVIAKSSLPFEEQPTPRSATSVDVASTTSDSPLAERDIWEQFIQQEASLGEIIRSYIESVLKATSWNKSKASRILQIERTTLDRRLAKYGVPRPGS